MGSIARMNQGDRFLAEFEDDINALYDLKPELTGSAVFVEGEDVVRYAIRISDKNGRVETFLSDQIFFDPEEDDENLIERVMQVFNLTKREAKIRLARADLI